MPSAIIKCYMQAGAVPIAPVVFHSISPSLRRYRKREELDVETLAAGWLYKLLRRKRKT
jgi:hypothetical protein